MTNTAVPSDDYQVSMRIRPERLAWSVLLIAFAVFCLICAGTTLAVQYFFFQSSVSLDTTLYATRGTVGISQSGSSEQAVTSQRSLGDDTRVRTGEDQWAQTTIEITDPRQGDALIARITLKSNTTLSLERALRPRFEWSWPASDIDLVDLRGEIDVTVAESLETDLLLTIGTATGEAIRITRSGRYVINATDSSVSLLARRGEAILIAADERTAVSIPGGQRGSINAGSATIDRAPAPVQLLDNSTLETGIEETPPPGVRTIQGPPLEWRCTNGPSMNLPLGQYGKAVTPEGNESFRLVRLDNASTNGHSRCFQTFGQDGLPVTEYAYLELQTTFLIDSQSLSGCGQEGSECPLMMSIKYKIDPNSDEVYEWIHGVYARPYDVDSNWRRQCGTCLQPHVRINEDIWYVYQSGNLFASIPNERRPAVIMRVDFFAEGHQYDVYVDEVALFAG